MPDSDDFPEGMGDILADLSGRWSCYLTEKNLIEGLRNFQFGNTSAAIARALSNAGSSYDKGVTCHECDLCQNMTNTKKKSYSASRSVGLTVVIQIEFNIACNTREVATILKCKSGSVSMHWS